MIVHLSCCLFLYNLSLIESQYFRSQKNLKSAVSRFSATKHLRPCSKHLSTGRWNYDVCELLRFVLCFYVDKNSMPERRRKITAQIIWWINHANLVFEEFAFAAFMIKYFAFLSSLPRFFVFEAESKLLIKSSRSEKKYRINNARVSIDLFFFAVPRFFVLFNERDET